MAAEDIMDLVTYFEDDPPSQPQIDLLLKWGYEVPETKEEATQTISHELEFRQNRGWRDDDHDGVAQCNDDTPYED